MIRMILPLIVLFLAYLLIRTFMERSGERPIDVDPVEASTGRGESKRDDDVIDVEPL